MCVRVCARAARVCVFVYVCVCASAHKKFFVPFKKIKRMYVYLYACMLDTFSLRAACISACVCARLSACVLVHTHTFCVEFKIINRMHMYVLCVSCAMEKNKVSI